jgi:3-dehydroquinate synthase
VVATSHELPYPITIADGALETVGDVAADVTPGRVVVITDRHVAEHYAKPVADSINRRRDRDDTILLSVPPGEALKTRDTWSHLTDALLENRIGRDACIVALGGGVIGDLAGFVAATYLRGISFVQVPTTLLAMVDASIGGKTGVDTRFGKNLVGAFHQPSAVIIDPRVLATLPDQVLRAGMAEVIKHGVIADAQYFGRIGTFVETLATRPFRWTEFIPVIRRSVEIKASIVSRDVREDGLRKVLNFGHTVAHALESLDDYATPHGQAVAMGLVTEARIAERVGVAESGTATAIENIVRRAQLPLLMPVRAEVADDLVQRTYADKKARAGRVEYALPQRIGEMAGADHGWTIPVEDSIVREVLTT